MLISEYIDLFERELFESCAPFWVKYGFDHENGGITTCLDREGKVYSTDKSVWMQGRCGYMYSRLHNVFPDRDPGEWLPLAKSAIDFATAHCPANGCLWQRAPSILLPHIVSIPTAECSSR